MLNMRMANGLEDPHLDYRHGGSSRELADAGTVGTKIHERSNGENQGFIFTNLLVVRQLIFRKASLPASYGLPRMDLISL